ncbi:MAG: cytidylate kinase-like family protein [Anaerolineales bacterium]|jgi:cytidylate kinase
MMKPCEKPLVITINHQIGSGGAVIGQKLSERLGVPFIDREILQQVSQKLNLLEGELEGREERLSSFWQSFGHMVEKMDPTQSLMTDRYFPTDKELFQIQSETISRIAENSQAIFIGRCCQYILRDHPCNFSLLVFADRSARIQRLCSLFHLSPGEADRMIETNDAERSAYIRSFTKQDWLDARLYDLCLNTSSTGVEQACDIIRAAILAKLSQ